ncbi:hypothetical protein X739_08695 [Mesorhizobium sp. LNHC220B00]|nr:hypothetical protein [Mesorhizobium sp. LNHC220B00]ESY87063.1 hypothetical protein X739_08695 [Mesorhizobium sp. LNHC220B00]
MNGLSKKFLIAALLIMTQGTGLHQITAAGMGVHPIEIRPIEPIRPFDSIGKDGVDPRFRDPGDETKDFGRSNGTSDAIGKAEARREALELVRDQLGKLSNPLPGSDFKPVREGDTIWFESPRYKGLRFSYEALFGGEMWLANAIRGPPVVINLAGPKASVTAEIAKLPNDQKNNLEIHNLDLSEDALLQAFTGLGKDRRVVILTHIRQADGKYLFSTVDESASISWARVQELQKQAGIDAITMGCRSACLPEAKAGVPNVFNQFDAIGAIRALNNHVSTTADLLSAVSTVADTALHVQTQVDVGAPRLTVKGQTKGGSPIIGYLPSVQSIPLNAASGTTGNLPGPLQKFAKADLCRGSDGSRDALCLQRLCQATRPASTSLPATGRELRILDGKLHFVSLLKWNCDNETAQLMTLAYNCLDPDLDLAGVRLAAPKNSAILSPLHQSLDLGPPVKLDLPQIPKILVPACMLLREATSAAAEAAMLAPRQQSDATPIEVPRQGPGPESEGNYLTGFLYAVIGVIVGGIVALSLLGVDDGRNRG